MKHTLWILDALITGEKRTKVRLGSGHSVLRLSQNPVREIGEPIDSKTGNMKAIDFHVPPRTPTSRRSIFLGKKVVQGISEVYA